MPEFVRVASLKDISPGKMKLVEVDREEVCLINSVGKIYAIQEHCTHEDGPLHEGVLEGNQVVCPWHDAKFDIKTGKADPTTEWAKRDLKVYEVKVDGDDIFVKGS